MKILGILILLAGAWPESAQGGSCRDNQYGFERFVRPFGESIKRSREAIVKSRTIQLATQKIRSGEWLQDTGRIFFGMGSYLEVFPPWYAERSPSPSEFYYDTAVSARTLASEAWQMYGLVQQAVTTRPIDRSFINERGLTRKFLRVVQQSSTGFIEGLGLVPVHMSFMHTPVRRILEKQFRDRNYRPSPQEVDVLKKNGMVEAFGERAVFLQNHPSLHRFQHASLVLFRSALFLSFVAVINNFLHMAEEGAMISAHTFLDDPKFMPDRAEVQLLVDMVPFPHLAIRIGNEVYSYGQTHLAKFSDAEYIRQRQLREIAYEPGVDGEQPDQTEARRFSYNGLTGVIEKLGLDQLPLSVQVVTLSLGEQETARVRKHLESNLGKRYVNETGVNDCATMVMRALNMENELIDASPSQVVMWFAMQKLNGSEMVESIRTVMVEDTDNPEGHLYRNTAINFLESQLFVRFFVLNQLHRFYIDQRYPESSDLQYYSEKTKALMRDYERQTKRVLESEVYLVKLRSKKNRIIESGSKQLRQSFRVEVGQYLQQLRQRSTSSRDSQDLYQMIFAAQFERIINDIERDILQGL